MANTAISLVGTTGTKTVTLDTTANIYLGMAPANVVGSFVVQAEGTTWTGTIKPQARVLGAVEAEVGWEDCAYTNLITGADVAGGTTITADALISIRADQGMEIQLVTTRAAGSVKLLWRVGTG